MNEKEEMKEKEEMFLVAAVPCSSPLMSYTTGVTPIFFRIVRCLEHCYLSCCYLLILASVSLSLPLIALLAHLSAESAHTFPHTFPLALDFAHTSALAFARIGGCP